MARCTLFCLAPTWTRGARLAFTLAGVALIAGCNFEHYEASPEPACPYTWVPLQGLSPVAHWTFDGDENTWLQQAGDVGAGLQLYRGATRDSTTRMNGTDNTSSSLFLDGSSGAFASGQLNLPTQSGFTWSVWISLGQNWKTDAGTDDVVWPILTTATEDTGCEGFRLEIRWTSGKPSPSLVFLQTMPSYAGCTAENKLEYSLDQPSWAWRAGIWHHAAVAFSPSSNVTTARLYWDGHLAPIGNFAMPNSDSTMKMLYLGANGENAPGFHGNIDELALFDRPLDEPDIANYALGSTTIAGPSGCRWRATEQRNDADNAGVSTVESMQVQGQQLQAKIFDEDWGGGLISAWLGPSRNLSHYAAIRLHAIIPETSTFNGDLEFGLHAGNDSCTWYIDTTSTTELQWYTIDLANPGYCQTNPLENCAFPLGKVEWASLGSPTEHPVSEVKGYLAYAIDQLELVPLGSGLDSLKIGGTSGPNNWCWRTEAFQVAQHAQAQIIPVDSNTIGASLCGDATSTPALVADFGDQTIDLSSGQLLIGTGGFTIPELILQDRNGTWAKCNIVSGSEPTTFALNGCSGDSATDYAKEPGYERFMPWEKFPIYDKKVVSRIKFQKSYGTPVDCATPATLAISSVAF